MNTEGFRQEMREAKTWKTLKVYECPDCGQWVRTIDDACNHKCARLKESERTIGRLESLKAITILKEELETIAWYKRSERRSIKLRIWELDTKRSFN